MQKRKSFLASPRLSFCDHYSIHSCIFCDGPVGIFLLRLSRSKYKLFTKIITTRLEKKLAGFRTKYSTTDHIHVIHIPLYVAFVDYEKAFDSLSNPSNIDIIARTRNRRCVHRNPERHIHGQLSDSTSAQRE